MFPLPHHSPILPPQDTGKVENGFAKLGKGGGGKAVRQAQRSEAVLPLALDALLIQESLMAAEPGASSSALWEAGGVGAILAKEPNVHLTTRRV